MKPSISLVVPMYNEEDNALRVVMSLDTGLQSISSSYEIIIVESGSTDNTKAIVDELGETYPCCRVFHQERKEGLGSAIRFGFSQSRNDLVLYMDGDEPFSVEEIKKALPLLGGVDAVLGYRVGERESFSRKLYSKGYNFLIRSLFGLRVKDVNFSFKLLKKRVVDSIELRSNGFFIDAEIIAEMKKNGFTWREMEVPYKIRQGGVSSVHVGPKMIGNMLKEMMKYIRRQ